MAVVREGEDRACIEGVRKISWHSGEACEFASSLVSAMGALGEEIPYSLVMGTTGAAFRLVLHADIWNPGSYGIRNITVDANEPIRRAFRAIGREFELREMGGEAEDTAAIRASIDRGVPVLAFGVVGPSDCCVVTGYDGAGKTLLGWSNFQDIPEDHDIPPDSTGYFRKPEWHGNTRGYLLIGGKHERPPRREIALDALWWAVELVRQSDVRGMPAGLDAYEVFADAVLEDRHFADASALFGPYLGILCILMMVDDRRAAIDFLAQAAADEPDMAPGLLAAADCYRETVRIRERLGTLLREDFSGEAMASLTDAAMRRKYAVAIREMRVHDEEAIAHIERLLT